MLPPTPGSAGCCVIKWWLRPSLAGRLPPGRFMLDRVAAVRGGLTPPPSRTGQYRVSPDQGQAAGDEADLIRAAQAGDRPAFAALIERYWDRLYRWICRLTRDATTAEDLTQETFLKAFAAVERFQAGSNFRAWLFRIGHNNFVNLRR